MKDYTKILQSPFAAETVDRLVRYAKIETTSDSHATVIPSTECQWNLGKLLVNELKALGVEDTIIDDKCFVIGKIKASAGCENIPTVGLMAHIDTSSDAPGKDVCPRIVKNYDGKKLELSSGIFLDPKDFEELPEYSGDTLVVTDGKTLLGADDKAGVSIIMTTVAHIMANKNIKHGPLVVIFSPDEETGNGMDGFPIDKVKMDACYTFDGGKMGEIESECFTAYEANIDFIGKSIHPGYARGKMANAVTMASKFVELLPWSESPECTDGWFGYYHAREISGVVEKANVIVIIRDFSDEGMARRLEAMKMYAKTIETLFPDGKVEMTIKKQYHNMKQKLDEKPQVLELLQKAAINVGAEPYSKPIRGGTDGARLTEMGIPTPNVFAGMHNFHGRFEWASVSEMVQAVNTSVELIQLWTK